MSHPSKPQPALFFTGLLYRNDLDFIKTLSILESSYGIIQDVMEPIAFKWTDYYASEMGRNLMRTWVYFKDLIEHEELVDRKLISLDIEKEFSDEYGNRKLNIDPGIMTQARLILSTFKDFSHRIYLGRGVFAEITLIYKDSDFHTLEWTYLDYADRENKKFFKSMRHYLKTTLGVMKSNGEI